MRIVIQRVSSGQVTVNGSVIGAISRGLVLLVGFGERDSEASLERVVSKVLNMRIFPDEKGRFHFSTLDIKGDVLLVPQFTLFADTSKGRRPEFFTALEPTKAKELFLKFAEIFRAQSPSRTECGEFGADMKVTLTNDGPVTILLDE